MTIRTISRRNSMYPSVSVPFLGKMYQLLFLKLLFLLCFLSLHLKTVDGSVTCDDYSHVTEFIGRQYAHQISREENYPGDENNVVDKNPNLCSKTKCHGDNISPWWRIDMSTIAKISKISITPKPDDAENLLNVDVLIAEYSPPVGRSKGVVYVNFTGYDLCNTIKEPLKKGDKSILVTCKKPLAGRYVALRKRPETNSSCTYLHLCEVDIWKAGRLVVNVVPDTKFIDAKNGVIFACDTQPLQCKNFHYEYYLDDQLIASGDSQYQRIKLGVTRSMAIQSLRCVVKNEKNIEISKGSFSLKSIRYRPDVKEPKCKWIKQRVIVGNPTALECKAVTANPVVEFDYIYDQKIFPSIYMNVTTETFKGYAGGKKVTSTLNIEKTLKEMNFQRIKIIVKHPLLDTATYKMRPLKVKFPPSETNTRLTAEVDTKVSQFHCIVEASYPKAMIDWKLLNTKNISVGNDVNLDRYVTPASHKKMSYGYSARSSLKLADHGLKLNGYTVQCVVKNIISTEPVVKSHIIRVKKAPDTSLVKLSLSPKRYGETDQLYITCDVPECYPPPKVTWNAPPLILQDSRQKNGNRVALADGNYYRAELRVSKVYKMFNLQKLTCEITHTLMNGSFETDPLSFNVEFPPNKADIQLTGASEMKEGSTEEFVCTVPESNPPADVKWIFQNSRSQPIDSVNDFGEQSVKVIDGKFGGSGLQTKFNMKVSKELNGFRLSCVVTHPRLIKNVTNSITFRVQYPPDTKAIELIKNPSELTTGTAVTFECISPTSIPDPNMMWDFGSSGLVDLHTLPRQKIIYVKEKRLIRLKFKVSSLTPAWDKQVVKCIVSHPLLPGKKVERQIALDVMFPPDERKIEFSPIPILQEGDNVNFICKSPESNPLAKIKWTLRMKDGKAIQLLEWNAKESFKTAIGVNGGRTTMAILKMPKAPREWDKATLSCTVQHPLLKIPEIRNQTIEVTYGFEIKDVKIYAKPPTINENENGTFFCLVPFASPPPVVKWIVPKIPNHQLKQLEKQTTDKEVNKFILILGPLSRIYNNETIRCSVSLNSWMRPRLWNITTSIRFSPIKKIPILGGSGVMTVGTKQDFTCTGSEASPMATLTWILKDRKNKTVKLDGKAKITLKKVRGERGSYIPISHLFFSSVSRSMNGYTLICQLSHEMVSGSHSERVKIRVRFTPKAENFTLQQDPTYTRPGLSVNFICDVPEASPKPSLSWVYPKEMEKYIKKREEIALGEEHGTIVKGILSLSNSSHIWNKAKITCIAKFNFSTPISKTIRLQIKFPPLNNHVAIDAPSAVKEGAMVVYRCVAPEALPRVTISWQMRNLDGSLVSLDDFSTQKTLEDKGIFGGIVAKGKLNFTAKIYMNNYQVRCSVDHELITTFSSEWRGLIVHFGPQQDGIQLIQEPRLISARKSGRFICIAPEALPRATIRWIYHDDIEPFKSIQSTVRAGSQLGEVVKSTLTIREVHSDWNGEKIRCVAMYAGFGQMDKTIPIRMKFPPKFNAPNLTAPREIIQQGDHASFVCLSTESSPAAKITWKLFDINKNHKQLPPNTQISSSTRPGKRGGFISISNLTINNIQTLMNGYTLSCLTNQKELKSPQMSNITIFLQPIKGGNRTTSNPNTTLTSHGPFSRNFTLQQEPPHAVPGRSLILICNVPDSIPLPDLEWQYPEHLKHFVKINTIAKMGFQYGQALQSNLTLTDIKHSWNNYYVRCIINHTATGVEERSISLSLKDATSFQGAMSFVPMSGQARAGQLMTASCAIKACRPRCSIYWSAKYTDKSKRFLMTETLQADFDGHAVSNLDLRMSEKLNDAKIVCTLNDTNKSLASPSLIILGAPKVTLTILKNNIRSNENAKFRCYSSIINPPINICEFGRWHNGKPNVLEWRKYSGVTFTRKINRYKGGIYFCTCRNDYGSDSDRAELIVQMASTKLSVNGTQVEAVENETVTVICENDAANPAADLTWDSVNITEMKFGVKSIPLPTSYKAFKTISRVTFKVHRKHNNAKIRCVAQNPFDNSILTKTIVIKVLYPPEVKIVPSKEYPAEGTTNFTLQCISKKGNPDTVRFKWLSPESVPLERKSTLAIPTLLRNNSGKRYTCIVTPNEHHVPRDKLERLVVQQEYEVKVSYLDVAIDKVVRLLNGADETNLLLNITASPMPTEFLWYSGQRALRVQSHVLSTMRDFSQVEVKLKTSLINKTLTGKHALGIKHRSGSRMFPVEVKIDPIFTEVNSDAGIDWNIIFIGASLMGTATLILIAVIIYRKKTRFRKTLVINGKGTCAASCGTEQLLLQLDASGKGSGPDASDQTKSIIHPLLAEKGTHV